MFVVKLWKNVLTSATHQLCILQRCIEIMYSGTKNPYHNITLGKQSCLPFSHFRVFFLWKRKAVGAGVGKCLAPGQRKICKCPTPGTDRVGKCPTVAGGGGSGHSWNWLMHKPAPWIFNVQNVASILYYYMCWDCYCYYYCYFIYCVIILCCIILLLLFSLFNN